jgi:CheY-like chemotaxis protein
MDGHELCTRLRQMQALARAMIYALTALDQEDRASPSPSNFDGHYTKPVDFKRLDVRDLYTQYTCFRQRLMYVRDKFPQVQST